MARKVEASRKLQKRAEQVIPGGVNSPVRAFRSVGCDPPFITRGQGSHLWDADENRYIDYVGSWGPLILGHAAPGVPEAISAAAKNGTSFGASTPAEADLAEIVISAFPQRRESAFRQFGHRSHHVGHPSGSRLHQAQIYCEVRGLLSRPCRRAAGEGWFGRGHAGYPRLGGSAGRIHPIDARPSVQ